MICRVPGGEGNEHLSAFSWHSYCWFLEFIDGDATDDDRQQAKERCDNWLLPKMFQSAQVTKYIYIITLVYVRYIGIQKL